VWNQQSSGSEWSFPVELGFFISVHVTYSFKVPLHNSELCHPVVCRKTNGEVNISHENTTMAVWIYDGV